ncbi:MAG: peptidase M28 [Candidatus Dadabacteria bacterium CSP1-2]|nr:MAG: peptidase M28 [Candidatus Dadabacteria bacterium CSP1-2]
MKLYIRGPHFWPRLVCIFLILVIVLGVYNMMGSRGISIKMPGRSYSGQFTPLTEEETEIRNHIKKHVEVLASEIGERNLREYNNLEGAVDYIEKTFRELNYEVSFQDFVVEGKITKNIEVEILGKSRPNEIIILGAHYDSVIGCPGANDNATGVAAILEFARLLKGGNLQCTVRFVAFTNEEPPFFQTENMGSLVYARRSRKRGENIVSMLSIETIGYYSDLKGSQRYPFPFSFFYPNTGNFIGFVSNASSRNLVHHVIASFRRNTHFPSEGVAAPGWMTGIGWSDQWSFWKEGYPGIMITDTAPFRYPYYHTQWDTPDKIDYDRMARVVAGLKRVIIGLTNTDKK